MLEEGRIKLDGKTQLIVLLIQNQLMIESVVSFEMDKIKFGKKYGGGLSHKELEPIM